jgi:hypothetical protein
MIIKDFSQEYYASCLICQKKSIALAPNPIALLICILQTTYLRETSLSINQNIKPFQKLKIEVAEVTWVIFVLFGLVWPLCLWLIVSTYTSVFFV